MRRASFFLFVLGSFGCADIIGLNALDDDGDGGATGGASSDEAGGTSAGGSSPGTGGSTADGGTDGDGGTSAGGTSADGGTSTGGADGAGGTDGDGGTSNGGGMTVNERPYACTDDEFTTAGVTTDCWQTFNEELLTGGGWSWEATNEPGDSPAGEISLLPTIGPGWADGNAGFFMYQEIKGNFLIEVYARIVEGGGSFNQPQIANAFGGVLVAPSNQPLTEGASNTHDNYYALKFGVFSNPVELGFRVEHTKDGSTTVRSALHPEIWETVILRLCRYEDTLFTAVWPHDEPGFTAWNIDESQAGTVTDTDELPALTETVRVGLIGEVFGGGGSGNALIVYDATELHQLESLSPCYANVLDAP